MTARPAALLVTGLLAAAVLAGVAGIVGCLRALRRGWPAPPRWLIAAGALATVGLALLSPVGSADPLSYAAYGRMAAVGLDPYATRPADLGALGDPFGAAVESPWQQTPSVYGPLATVVHALAAGVADDPRTAVWLLGLGNAAAFLGVGLLLQRVLAPDRSAQARAALLWTANPLLLQQLVAGGHVDTLVALGAAAAVTAARGNALLAGALAGAATAVKLPAALVGGGLALTQLRHPRRLGALAAGAGAVLVPAYLLAGPHAFDQLRKASRFVARATPWRAVTEPLDAAYGDSTSRRLIALLALVLAAALALLLAKGLPPGTAVPAARPTLALTLGWLLAAPYALPWYDATAWVLLALLAASAYDTVLIVHTAVLALAYLPGRDVPLPPGLGATVTVVRDDLAPLALTAVIVVAAVLALRRAARPPDGSTSKTHLDPAGWSA